MGSGIPEVRQSYREYFSVAPKWGFWGGGVPPAPIYIYKGILIRGIGLYWGYFGKKKLLPGCILFQSYPKSCVTWLRNFWHLVGKNRTTEVIFFFLNNPEKNDHIPAQIQSYPVAGYVKNLKIWENHDISLYPLGQTTKSLHTCFKTHRRGIYI